MPTPSPPATATFMPDFCSRRMVVAVVVLSQLFAIVLSLASAAPTSLTADTLRVSLFVQWNGLAGAAALCVLRRPLARLSDAGAALIGYLTLLLVTLLVSEVALLLDNTVSASLVGSDPPRFLLRNLSVAAVVSALALRYFYVQKQWQERTRAEAEARIAALQARIRPHFLFNSMNTIASLTRTQPETAEKVVEDLPDLFRVSIGDHRRLITLREELDLSRRYLEIERLRLGDRLRIEWDVKAPEDGILPPLTIQPLVENAVYHGIETRREGGTVRIDARETADRLVVSVSNPAGGGQQTKGNRVAVDNVRQRLEAHFGRRASLTTEVQGERHVARLAIPHRKATA